MSHPGIDYGFQTADLRYITIPSQRGVDISCCCDLLWKPRYGEELYGTVQFQLPKRKVYSAGTGLGCGDCIIHGVPGSKGDILYKQSLLERSKAFGISCDDGKVHFDRKQKSSTNNTGGEGRIHLSP